MRMYKVIYCNAFLLTSCFYLVRPVCSTQTYGARCSQTCGNCSNGETCDHVNGTCLHGCNEGAQGGECKTGTCVRCLTCKKLTC